MAVIVEAKGLRYTVILTDDHVQIKENANIKESISNIIKKIKKDQDLLVNESYKLTEIIRANFEELSQDTSKLTLELNNERIRTFEMSAKDKYLSNALKTHVKQIADYIQSKKRSVS